MRRGMQIKRQFNSTKSGMQGMPPEDDDEKKRLRTENVGATVAVGIMSLVAILLFIVALAASAGRH